MLKIKRSVPFHIQVYQILREEIITGRKKPGERLFENKVSKDLGVSRSPVREALRMLEYDGLVVNTENGLVIYSMDFEDIKEIWQCRIATEPYAAFLATEKISLKEIERISRLVDQAAKAQQKGDYKTVAQLNEAFHESIVRASGNGRLIEIIERVRSLVLLARTTEFINYGPRENILKEHIQVLDAFRERDPFKAEATLRKHYEDDWIYFQEYLKSKAGE